MARYALRFTLALVGVLGLAWTADALVTTDEERLQSIADTLSGRVEDDRLAAALAHVDLEREPMELVRRGAIDFYEPGDEAALDADLRRGVAPYLGETARLLQQQVEVDGDEGRVAVRVIVGGELADLQLRLRRHGERWLVRRVRVL